MDTLSLHEFVAEMMEFLRLRQDLSIVLLSDRAIRLYNRRFASKDCATDVLSFPNEVEGWEDEESESYLGDILISVETAEAQRKGTLMGELKTLSLHGLLHLLGYDHETDQGEMRALEDSLKKELGLL